MDAFLENCRELKRQKEIEDRKFDEMLEELNKMKRKQKEAERERLKAAKEELFNVSAFLISDFVSDFQV